MRALLLWLAIAGGCAHARRGPPVALGGHPAYEGKPAWLSCPAREVAQAPPCPRPARLAGRAQFSDAGGQLRPSMPGSRAERLQRLRAVLAAVDAQVAALDDHPTHEQVAVLDRSARELRQLLEAWPDTLAEADELEQVVGRLETELPIRQPLLRLRLAQLADLIRLQVVVGGE